MILKTVHEPPHITMRCDYCQTEVNEIGLSDVEMICKHSWIVSVDQAKVIYIHFCCGVHAKKYWDEKLLEMLA